MKIHHLIILLGSALLLLCASQIRPLFEPTPDEPALTREFQLLQERLDAAGKSWPPELFTLRVAAAIDAAHERDLAQARTDRRARTYFFVMVLAGVLAVVLGLGQRSVDSVRPA